MIPHNSGQKCHLKRAASIALKMTAPKISLFTFNLFFLDVVENLGDSLLPGTLVKMAFFRLMFVPIAIGESLSDFV